MAEVKKQHVEQLPIPKNISTDNQKEIISAVEHLLQLSCEKQLTRLPEKIEQLQNRIDHLEFKINQIVFDIYELNDDERKIISAI